MSRALIRAVASKGLRYRGLTKAGRRSMALRRAGIKVVPSGHPGRSLARARDAWAWHLRDGGW